MEEDEGHFWLQSQNSDFNLKIHFSYIRDFSSWEFEKKRDEQRVYFFQQKPLKEKKNIF